MKIRKIAAAVALATTTLSVYAQSTTCAANVNPLASCEDLLWNQANSSITIAAGQSVNGSYLNTPSVAVTVGANSANVVLGSLINSGMIGDFNPPTYGISVLANTRVELIRNNPDGGIVAISSAIRNMGIIDRLENYGGMFSLTSTPYIENSGAIIKVLVNGQGQMGSQSYPLIWHGNAPEQYLVLITDVSHYGQLKVSQTHTIWNYESLRFGIAPGSVVQAGLYQGIIIKDDSFIFGYTPKTGTYMDANGTIWPFMLFYTSATSEFNLSIGTGYQINVASSVSSTGNRQAAGAARVIDANAGLTALFATAAGNGDRAVSTAVTQTLPLANGAATAAARSAMGSASGIVQARIDSGNGRASGDYFLGDKNFWMKPFATRADQNERDGIAGYRAETYGLALGMDGEAAPALRLGAAFAYANSDIAGKSAEAPQGSVIDVYQLIGYGSYRLDERTTLDAQASVGQNTSRSHRPIPFATAVATARYDSRTAHVGVSLGRSYALSGDTTLTPSIRADYTWIRDQAYGETGADLLNLNVAARATEALVVGIDGKLSHRLNDRTTLLANLGVGYDTIGKQDAVTAAFAGASDAAFVTYGIDPSPWLGRGGFGAAYRLKNGLEITGRYDIEYRASFLNQTASANLRWAF